MLFICLLVYFFLVFTFVWSTSVSAPRGLLNPLPLFCYRHLLVLTGYLLLALFWQAELSSSHSSTSSSSFLIAYFFLPHSLLFSLAVIWQLWCFLSLARKEDGESKRRLEKSSLYFFCNCPPTTLLTPPPQPTCLRPFGMFGPWHRYTLISVDCVHEPDPAVPNNLLLGDRTGARQGLKAARLLWHLWRPLCSCNLLVRWKTKQDGLICRRGLEVAHWDMWHQLKRCCDPS